MVECMRCQSMHGPREFVRNVKNVENESIYESSDDNNYEYSIEMPKNEIFVSNCKKSIWGKLCRLRIEK